MRQLHIYLEDEQYKRIRKEAFEAEITMSEVVRRYLNPSPLEIALEENKNVNLPKAVEDKLYVEPEMKKHISQFVKKSTNMEFCQKHIGSRKSTCGCK